MGISISELLELIKKMWDAGESIAEGVSTIKDKRIRKGTAKAVAKALKAKTQKDKDKAIEKIRDWMWEK